MAAAWQRSINLLWNYKISVSVRRLFVWLFLFVLFLCMLFAFKLPKCNLELCYIYSRKYSAIVKSFLWWRGGPPYNGLWGGFVQIWYSKFWYLFHGSGTWKGRDFTDWGIWKPGRENCHFSLLKAPKALRDAFYGSEKSRKLSAFTAGRRGWSV